MLREENGPAERVCTDVHLTQHKLEISASKTFFSGSRNHEVRTMITSKTPTWTSCIKGGFYARPEFFNAVMDPTLMPGDVENFGPAVLKFRKQDINQALFGAEHSRLRERPEVNEVNHRRS